MEDDKQKEQNELRALLENPDNPSGADDDQNKDPAASPEDNQDDGPDNGDDKSKKDDVGKDGDKNKNLNKEDRWNGKSREDVIKEVESLETRIAGLEKKDKKPEKTPKDEKKDEAGPLPSAEELQKMTPSDFAKWVLSRIDEGVKTTIASQEKIRNAVRNEIEEAKKNHPLDDPDYRKMVLTIIDAASSKGTTVSLQDACEQVDAFIGKHTSKSEEISDEERSRLKKAKAQVESGAGAPAQPENPDAETERIQKALGRSGSKGSLGGLGI